MDAKLIKRAKALYETRLPAATRYRFEEEEPGVVRCLDSETGSRLVIDFRGSRARVVSGYNNELGEPV